MFGKPRTWEIARKEKISKVVRGRCKRSFGHREQRSPKSVLHHPNPLSHGCNPILHHCKGFFCSLGPNHLLHPLLTTFGRFSLSANFPGPWLPNPMSKIWKMKSSNLFEGLIIYSHALYMSSADDSVRFLQNPGEIAQIVGGQIAQ